MTQEEKQALIRAAVKARAFSYCPYSGFSVGAALLGKSGAVYTGCNVESASYTPTQCAERTALGKAVSEGEREFTAIAVVGGKAGQAPGGYTSPCGVCRQMLYEFGAQSLLVLMARSEQDFQERTLGELLPMGFGPDMMREEA